MNFSEIDQQPQLSPAQAELREYLFAVDAGQFFNRFQLYDHLVLDEKIGAKSLLKHQLVVVDRDGNLSFDLQVLPSQFVREKHLVNGFEQSRAGFGVNLESRVEDDFGQLVFGKCSGWHRLSACACLRLCSSKALCNRREGHRAHSLKNPS